MLADWGGVTASPHVAGLAAYLLVVEGLNGSPNRIVYNGSGM